MTQYDRDYLRGWTNAAEMIDCEWSERQINEFASMLLQTMPGPLSNGFTDAVLSAYGD
jgi:hypothetical protein